MFAHSAIAVLNMICQLCLYPGCVQYRNMKGGGSMAIELFRHNQQAYEAVLAMLKETGRAAVIHPTGTGKSFIAFRLCEAFPEKRFCWLSPSEYIFKTQLENLRRTSGFCPENIQFLTYAKLMLMQPDEICQLQPDCVILDEFHRCGAEMWGQGVKNLLAAFPEIPIVGLSATAIRYLDNQRDMAQELFGGHVASEMTLGEAIVQGILHPPKYVMAAYRYQKDLEKYEKRVASIRNPVARDKADAVLEDLRRSLDKADGLDVIFNRHMENRTGKYIVFCGNIDHMEQMAELAPEWFGKVDACPHIYKVYAADPLVDKAFSDFKADSSGHLKLLYCIDMLNEGIHVEDVDGVILLRPTISPIIYKQQIGRALSAGNKKQSVIFDIVLNIENLYSIGFIEEEMQQAMAFYRSHGMESRIVHEGFYLVDEVRDCMALFERLNEHLTASWDVMYQLAREYYQENGDLDVPRRYTTAQGYSLGEWVSSQRKIYSGVKCGKLTDRQIEKLDAIGMRWEDWFSIGWNKYYAALCDYKEQNGNIDIAARYRTPDGLPLGNFIRNLRMARSTGKRNGYLTPERIAQLDSMGMIWDKLDYQWEINYLACAKYYLEHGSLDIPSNYVSEDGLKIGTWMRRQRGIRQGLVNGRTLSEEKIERLNSIGMRWDDSYSSKWEYGYSRAAEYKRTHGHLRVPSIYVDETGFPLGKWIRRHNETRADGTTVIKVTPERRQRLDALGMEWK